jgi:hypothetical protein
MRTVSALVSVVVRVEASINRETVIGVALSAEDAADMVRAIQVGRFSEVHLHVAVPDGANVEVFGPVADELDRAGFPDLGRLFRALG